MAYALRLHGVAKTGKNSDNAAEVGAVARKSKRLAPGAVCGKSCDSAQLFTEPGVPSEQDGKAGDWRGGVAPMHAVKGPAS